MQSKQLGAEQPATKAELEEHASENEIKKSN